jgi:hypothetical protein
MAKPEVIAEKRVTLSRKNGATTGPGNPPVEHRFQRGNPGRPKGSRNKLSEAFVLALHDDFAAHGQQVIEMVRKEKPDAYLRVVASLVPRDLNLSFDPLAELSDADLVERIRILDAEIRPLLARTFDEEADTDTALH